MTAGKKNNMTLGEALKQFLHQNRLQQGIHAVEAEHAWRSVLGPGVDSYTRTVELKGNTLFVSLDSSVLREELSLGKSKIIALLNESLGSEVIQKLVLR